MKQAKIHMAKGGDILIELFDKEAPGTVQNFIDLINKGFYNGLRFHRVIPESQLGLALTTCCCLQPL